MSKLIITADDYGMCKPVNDAIELCMEAGIVQATCIMSNMGAYKESSNLRSKFKNVSIGIHWNLTLGKPILLPSKIPSLVDGEGNFFSAKVFRQKFVFGRIDLSDIKAELTAQYESFFHIVGKPDFWNTHQNIHLYPVLFHFLVGIGRNLGIPAMRCHRRITVPKEMTAERYNFSHPLFWIKGMILQHWANQAERQRVLMPLGVIEMPGGEIGKGSFETHMMRIPWHRIKQPVELIIHPALSIQSDLFGPLTESRIKEFTVFSDVNLISKLNKKQIELVNFSSLTG